MSEAGTQRTARHLFFLLASCLVVSTLHAAATEWKTNPNGQVRLIAAVDSVSRHGTLLLGFQFKTAPGWYVYWKVAGDAGYPPNVKWEGSKGFVNPNVLWPAPTKFILPGNITEFGYEGEVVYPVEATLKPEGDIIHIAATISYLTCYTACIPYKYAFSLDLPLKETEMPGAKQAGVRSEMWRTDSESKALIDRFQAQVPPAARTEAEIMKAAPTLVINPILSSEAPPSSPPLSTYSLIFLAFIGGLLLNVMPCVLPVLAIKLLGIMKHSGHAHHVIVRNSLLSAAGIMTSFLGLGFIAVLAKVAGRAVGWGIQFQNPAFVMLLAVVLFLFALNMWGVFEIGMPRVFGHFAQTYGQRETPLAHFTSGLFATLLATPCSAPFLGTAMGFALAQPPVTVMTAFAVAGVGMAMPYFILAGFPRSLDWLPKPGAWMVRLKTYLGMILALTALWLVWVFLQQVRPTPHEAFSESRIETLLAEGKPVLVDVTADWCVTCKYNERIVLNSSEVKRILAARGIVMLRADWTTRDETIRQYLAKFGRSGIPFYAFYEPGKEPVALSEFLTTQKVLSVLNN